MIWRSHATGEVEPHIILPIPQSLHWSRYTDAAIPELFWLIWIYSICGDISNSRILLRVLGVGLVTVRYAGVHGYFLSQFCTVTSSLLRLHINIGHASDHPHMQQTSSQHIKKWCVSCDQVLTESGRWQFLLSTFVCVTRPRHVFSKMSQLWFAPTLCTVTERFVNNTTWTWRDICNEMLFYSECLPYFLCLIILKAFVCVVL